MQSAIQTLCKINILNWKKLFATGFPYRHCNFWLLCLRTRQDGIGKRDKAYCAFGIRVKLFASSKNLKLNQQH